MKFKTKKAMQAEIDRLKMELREAIKEKDNVVSILETYRDINDTIQGQITTDYCEYCKHCTEVDKLYTVNGDVWGCKYICRKQINCENFEVKEDD